MSDGRTDILPHPPDGLWLWRKERRDGVSKGIAAVAAAAVASFIVEQSHLSPARPEAGFHGNATQRRKGAAISAVAVILSELTGRGRARRRTTTTTRLNHSAFSRSLSRSPCLLRGQVLRMESGPPQKMTMATIIKRAAAVMLGGGEEGRGPRCVYATRILWDTGGG